MLCGVLAEFIAHIGRSKHKVEGKHLSYFSTQADTKKGKKVSYSSSSLVILQVLVQTTEQDRPGKLKPAENRLCD